MIKAIELSEQQQKEVLEFFKAKREQQAKDLEVTDGIIAKLLLNDSPPETNNNSADDAIPSKGRGVIVPLKYKIDEILKSSETPLSARQIMNGLIRVDPDINKNENALRKTVASALSQNSKNDSSRYLRKNEMGLSYYSLNENYKENE